MKVTLRYVMVLIKLSLVSCQGVPQEEDTILQYNQRMDSIASARIDSAYKQISAACDTAIKYRVPAIVDSLLKADSLTHE